jgi:putative ABC transport system ATP-binding protein
LENVVEVENVYKRYMLGKTEVPVLNGVSMRIRRGEIVSIMGPSGSGKSTLLHLIGALDTPTSGKIYFEGQDISNLDDSKLAALRNKKIGFVFQTFNLVPRMNAVKNVELPLILSGMPEGARRERAIELLKIVGLEHRLDHRPSELSGGERQRVAIARALSNNPQVVLCDEPTGNVDTRAGAEIMEVIARLNLENKQTFVIVTHDPSVAQYGERILYIRDGVIKGEKRVK